MKWMRWLVPLAWRDTVQNDLEDEARVSKHGAWWQVWQIASVALRLRLVVSGDALRSDLRYAWKTGWRSKAFALGAILTFALGVGVNVAVFSAVDRMMLRPLPYGDPDRLVVMGAYSTDGVGPYGTIPASKLSAVKEQHQGIVDLAIVGQAVSHASDVDGAQTLLFALASYNALEVLGVRPFAGRGFTREDATSKRIGVLLTYETWQSRFGGQPDIVGARVWRDRKPVDVIGVLPPGFFVPPNNWVGRADGLMLDHDALIAAYGPKDTESPPYVRLKPGVSVEVAEQEMRAITSAVGPAFPATAFLRLAPVREAMFGVYATYTWLVIVASTLVLLMCCANLTSLMFVRARSREHQVALTVALGASRARVVRLAVIESLMFASGGTVVALGVLVWTQTALQGMLPEIFRRYAASPGDARVLGFALVATVACALIAGVWPVARTTSANAAAVMQRGGGRHSSGARTGSAFVMAAEAFIAVVLVSGAVMTARSLVGLLRTDLGFAPAGLHALSLQPPAPVTDPTERYRIQMQVLREVREVAGVESAAAADAFPFEGAREGPFLPGQRDSQSSRVTSEYFKTMGIPLLAGRGINPGDSIAAGSVAVLNEMGLSRVWPGVSPSDALGRVLQIERLPTSVMVGVVGNVRGSPASKEEAVLYLPLSAERFRRLTIAVRTAPEASVPVRDIESRLASAGLPMKVTASPVVARMAESLRDQRFRAQLFGAFGLVALMLSCVGLYAVTAFDAGTRRAEMGVRLVLGATPRALRRLVLTRALVPTATGAAAGLVVAWWAGTYLQAFLHQVDARDLGPLSIVGAVLIGAAALAAWLPARRASRVDPATALRAD